MLMKVLIAFDVDGTLECGNPPGPIRLERVRLLKEAGFTVGIIGALERVMPKLPNLDFYYPGDPHKPEGLKEVKEKFKPLLAIYVADLPSDRKSALKLSYSYIHSIDFR